ncbi:MAG TPA: hypothetical protein VN238_21015 [Solirubrobacteraceae bacterium]|nr:hypothetical protein [Solirubrobacteraceae bacterium]
MPEPTTTAAQENVEALVEHTRALVDIDRTRNQHADVRAGGLALLANGLLAVAATFGPRVTAGRTAHDPLLVVYGAGLLLLLFAGASAAMTLWRSARPVFALGRVGDYADSAKHHADPLALHRELLGGWIVALSEERLVLDLKRKYLERGYAFFVGGLVTLVAVAVTLASGAT